MVFYEKGLSYPNFVEEGDFQWACKFKKQREQEKIGQECNTYNCDELLSGYRAWLVSNSKKV